MLNVHLLYFRKPFLHFWKHNYEFDHLNRTDKRASPSIQIRTNLGLWKVPKKERDACIQFKTSFKWVIDCKTKCKFAWIASVKTKAWRTSLTHEHLLSTAKAADDILWNTNWHWSGILLPFVVVILLFSSLSFFFQVRGSFISNLVRILKCIELQEHWKLWEIDFICKSEPSQSIASRWHLNNVNFNQRHETVIPFFFLL